MSDKFELWLIRHGETEWSLSGAHTGRTDIALTEKGREQATSLRSMLQGQTFAKVLVSPRIRAQDTCHLAGLGDGAETVEDLAEWDYGDLEGKTTPEIRKMIQGWAIWKGPIPGGETLEQVAIRARRVVERAIVQPGPVALFAHGHILRILTACWLEIEPDGGRLFALGTGSISTLGYEHDTRVITRWNLQGPL